jgi:hypothetical protein
MIDAVEVKSLSDRYYFLRRRFNFSQSGNSEISLRAAMQFRIGYRFRRWIDGGHQPKVSVLSSPLDVIECG